MERRLVLLDFDGTITRSDTLFKFIRFYHGTTWFIGGFLILSPVLVGLALKFISNHEAKQRVLRFFFGNIPIDKFDARCMDFATSVIPRLIRPEAGNLLARELARKAVVVVVSASPENWVKPWCQALNIRCLATRLEVTNQKLSGNIRGKNCYGPEKVARIKEVFSLEDFDQVIAYGDSKGDREMLQLAHESHYKPF